VIIWWKRLDFWERVLHNNNLLIQLLLNTTSRLLMQIENFSSIILIIQPRRHYVLRSSEIYRHILDVCAATDTNCHIWLLWFTLDRIYEFIVILIKTLICCPFYLSVSQISIASLQIWILTVVLEWKIVTVI
jgi:hypothetical protein